jgi:hypothetical protein
MDYADIREGLYEHLCTEIPAVGDRVFWGYTAPADTEKPFLVMTFMGELPSLNTPLGTFMQFTVDVFGEEGNIIAIDPIADDVVAAIHQVDITTPDGRIIRGEYRRDARTDFWSETFRASVISNRFLLPTDFWT